MLSACASPPPAPEATGIEFDPGDAPSRGPASAPVQLVEFADFRCGYCARFQPVLTGLLEQYPERVRLAFVHMPVVSRDSGMPARVRYDRTVSALRAPSDRLYSSVAMLQQ